MSLMGRERRLATIAEIAELLVFEVSGTAFRYILEQQPSLLGKLGETVHTRLIEREEAVEGARSQRLGETPSDILTSIKDFFGL